MEIEMESPGDPSCSTNTKEKKKNHNHSLEQRKGEHMGTKEQYANPSCKHASNPYHSCGPYCSSNNSHPSQSRDTNDVVANQRRKEIAKGKAIIIAEPGAAVNGVKQVMIVDKKIVNPNCINASNPYHHCGNHCLSNPSKQGQTKMMVRVVSNEPPSRHVNMTRGNSNSNSNSKCKNASNPYHKCAEYCFKTPPNHHDPQPKKERLKKRNGHSNPAENQVKALESNTEEGDEKLMDNDNKKRNSWSFHEEDLVEKVGILKGSEHDLEASQERDLYLNEIDAFDFHPQKVNTAEENKKTDDEKINTSNSYSNSAPNLLKKLPKSDHQHKNGKAGSPFHFGVLLIAVLYYIAHVIITGAVFPEGKTNARIKYKESEDVKREGIHTSNC